MGNGVVWISGPQTVSLQVYRIYQLTRAVQFIQTFMFAMKDAPITQQLLAINGALVSLIVTFLILGVFSLWSLLTFLLRLFPSRPVAENYWSMGRICYHFTLPCSCAYNSGVLYGSSRKLLSIRALGLVPLPFLSQVIKGTWQFWQSTVVYFLVHCFHTNFQEIGVRERMNDQKWFSLKQEKETNCSCTI